MEKSDFTQQFASRLREAMITAGFESERSASRVNLNVLVAITGYSIQICRKYLRGEAIPEPVKLREIARKLGVSPGWLLFGEQDREMGEGDTIIITKNILHYIFTRAAPLYNVAHIEDDVPNFLLELIQDLNQINVNEEQSKKIIDLALSSAKHFSHPI